MTQKINAFEQQGFRTSVQVIADHAKASQDLVAMRQKRFGIWNETTWRELHHKVRSLASALIELGVKPNDKIGILSENRQEWVLTQFAAQAAGAVVVGMYPTSPAAELDHLINASETELLFIEDQEQFDKIVELSGKAQHLKRLVVFEPKGLKAASEMETRLTGKVNAQITRNADTSDGVPW